MVRNEYTTLRAISDWPGFDGEQDDRRAESRQWIVDRIEQIEADADNTGWSRANRKERHAFLSKLNSGAPKHEVRLPCPATATDAEKSYIEERECWAWVQSTTTEQKVRKQACTDWLVARRKSLYHLLHSASNDANHKNDRQARYNALCIATRYGSAYKSWAKDHNKWGVLLTPKTPDDWRHVCVTDAAKYIGVHEVPSGSNKGTPQPSGWQRRVYGDDGVPWCACFAVCQAWDVGVEGTGTAAVQLNMQLAQKGQGIYRGATTDPSKVSPADHVVVHCETCHQAIVEHDAYFTIEGNTSASNGMNFNGGEVARHDRHGQVVCWLLVRAPSSVH